MEGIAHLLDLAKMLRRDNSTKWPFSREQWRMAIDTAVADIEPPFDHDLAEASQGLRSAIRRLGDSGDARFGSSNVGRFPGSSYAGNRYCDDLDDTLRRFNVLKDLLSRRDH